MECRLVNEEEVKISLSPRDLDQWGVSLEELDCKVERVRRILREWLRLAGEQTGRLASEKMLIKLFPKRAGGCDLYVSGWLGPREEGEYFLFDSLDDWLRLYSLLSREEKTRWTNGVALPSGRWLALCLNTEGMGERIFDFASPLNGEYLSCYLSEHKEEL